jgi:hypothetical protein
MVPERTFGSLGVVAVCAAVALACGGSAREDAGGMSPASTGTSAGMGAGADAGPSTPVSSATGPATGQAGGRVSDRALGFSLEPPAGVEIVAPQPSDGVPPVGRVGWVRYSLAGDPDALPALSIEVWDALGAASLRAWVAENRRPPALASLQPEAETRGALEALRLRDPRERLPNEFLFYRTRHRIYVVTPIGDDGRRAASSFRVEPVP